jgi:hypothetical protein
MTEFDIEEAIIGKAEKVSVPNSPSPPPRALPQVDLPVFTPLSLVPLPHFPRTASTEKQEDVHLDHPTPTRHQTRPQPQAQPQPQPPFPKPFQIPPKDTTDTASIRSTKSTRSTKSACAKTADGTPNQLNLVTSARKRSHRTSKGSLRLPRARSHSRSHSRTHSNDHTQGHDEEDHPPVPDIPLEFSMGPPFPVPASPKPSSNIVWPGSSTHSRVSLNTHSHSHPHSRQVSHKMSLDDIAPLRTPRVRVRERERGRRDSSESYAPTITVDDIHVPPPSYHGHNEVHVVPRTPTLTTTFTLPPMPVLRSLRRKISNAKSGAVDPRNRLSQSVHTALDTVSVQLSPPLSPTSLPLPPSPLTPLSPASFDTDMTERGRDRDRERGGNRLFSGAGIPSMWLHADSRPNRDHGDQGRGMTVSPPRGHGGEGEPGHEHGNRTGTRTGNVTRNGSITGFGNGNGIGSMGGIGRQSRRPYEKLKTLTKRYSLNFPLSMLVDRARPGTSSGVGAGATGMGWRPTSHVSSPN